MNTSALYFPYTSTNFRSSPVDPNAPRKRVTVGPEESAKRKARIEAWKRGEEVVKPKAYRRTRGKRPVPTRQHSALLKRLGFPKGLPSGVGQQHAKLVWLYLCSHLRRGTDHTDVYPSNELIARATRLCLRDVERAMAYLAKHELISVKNGIRQGLRKPQGRIITLHLSGSGPNPVVRFPKAEMMDRIWYWARVRPRPISLVVTMVAIVIHVVAYDGAEFDQDTSLHVPLSAIRDMVGASLGSTFTMRLADLERAGLISRVGEFWREGIVVHVPEPIPRIQRETHPVPPQLRRFPRIPACSGLVSLDDLDEMRAMEATARAWTSPKDERPWWLDEHHPN